MKLSERVKNLEEKERERAKWCQSELDENTEAAQGVYEKVRLHRN